MINPPRKLNSIRRDVENGRITRSLGLPTQPPQRSRARTAPQRDVGDETTPPQLLHEQIKSRERERFLSMDKEFLLENRSTLRSLSEFGAVTVFFYICDRTNLFGESTKVDYMYSFFLFFVFCRVALRQRPFPLSLLPSYYRRSDYFSQEASENSPVLEKVRAVLFVMYHYFAAKEIYNAIRVFIAAYVWMTGFGNFSYYYVRKDFSFARMMWRLNFFVAFCCIALDKPLRCCNYICPNATPFFTSIGVLRALAL
ncbi:Protein REDUCED WALL ACETYLATION 1 [Ananas comosus]|uniref:Protein REDUCED WALL ACETYLATION 1 n=1 Tax=Ananas comosus TaxID=4615 RepID=A0A199UWE3_ANACO|nr:Protein REDUCED WALL ACETYLATION 1 [Ananas comosus]